MPRSGALRRRALNRRFGLPGVAEPQRPRDAIEDWRVSIRFAIRDDRRDVKQITVGEKRRVKADLFGAAQSRSVDESQTETTALRELDVTGIGCASTAPCRLPSNRVPSSSST